MNEAPSPPGEVRSYLRRLLITISVGIILMASAAVWAYQTYGKKLDTAPPLPPAPPPPPYAPPP